MPRFTTECVPARARSPPIYESEAPQWKVADFALHSQIEGQQICI
jgi:hypothetical protein